MKKLISIIARYKIHHLFFWLVYYVGWVQVYRNFYAELSDLLMVTGVYALAHGSMYYSTQYFLIPRFLKTRRTILFILLFAIQLMLVTFLMYLGIIFILRQPFDSVFGLPAFNFLINLGFSNVFMTSVLLSIKALLDYLRNQRNEEKKEKQRLEAELQYLKSQVNPHFLFNTINSVYVLINQDTRKASETLIKLSDLLRAQLYDFGQDLISIEQEISYLQNYIELEKLRKGDKLHFEIEIGPEVSGFRIAPLMLMPFLENCFKHAMAPQSEKNSIRIKLERDNAVFSTSFFNTKDATVEKDQNQPGGIGLKNIKRRLELLYPHKHELKINDLPNGFEVNLKLKIHD